MVQDRGPDVRFPPPILFVGGLLGGLALDRVGLLPALAAPSFVLELVGVIAGTVGIAVVFTGILTFRRARTAVYPNRPASRIVQHGIYARTRNPMYVGLTLLYVGMTLAFVSTGAVLLLPLVLLALHRYVIAREERYLQAAFPDEYAAYCARVGRWW